MPSKVKDFPDICLFLSKDGYATRLEKIAFHGKETRDPISTQIEIKT